MNKRLFQIIIMTGVVLWIGIISPEIFIDAGTGCVADENGRNISREEAREVLEKIFWYDEVSDLDDDTEILFKYKLFERF